MIVARGAPKLAGSLPLLVIVGLVLIGTALFVIIDVAHRRREQLRNRDRYLFDDHGRIVGREKPPPPHSFCAWYVCVDPKAPKPCRRRQGLR